MATQNLDGQTEEAASIRVFQASEMDDRWLRDGWRIAAIYEEMVLMFETDNLPNGGYSSRSILRPQARFLCVRGARKDLVALLQADVDAAKKKIDETVSELRKVREDLVVKTRQHEEATRLQERLRETNDKLQAEARDECARHRKMEADLGQVRAAMSQPMVSFPPELSAIARFSEGWDGDGAPAPSAAALADAAVLLHEASKIGLQATEIDADVLGGVALHFANADRTAWVACMNTGSVTVVCRSTAERTVEGGRPLEVAAKLALFIQGERHSPRTRNCTGEIAFKKICGGDKS